MENSVPAMQMPVPETPAVVAPMDVEGASMDVEGVIQDSLQKFKKEFEDVQCEYQVCRPSDHGHVRVLISLIRSVVAWGRSGLTWPCG